LELDNQKQKRVVLSPVHHRAIAFSYLPASVAKVEIGKVIILL